MVKSYRLPVTLPAVVTHYFEPSSKNILAFVGGTRAAHQMYVAHQIRLLNTILGAVKGRFGANAKDIALQNRALSNEDYVHLVNIVDLLLKSELIDLDLAKQMQINLSDLFTHIFPQINSSNLLFNRGSAP